MPLSPFIIVLIIFLRYAIIAAIPFLIYYVWKRKKWSYKKIQAKFPKNKDYFREFLYSMLTIFIFGGIAISLMHPAIKPYTKFYEDINTYGSGYFFLSIFMCIFLHDTYFYWTHRFMHLKPIYQFFHKTHHKSTNPSPWAAFAFHPAEAVVEAGIVVLIVFTFPIHPFAIIAFILFMMVYNVYGHLGYEIYPKGLIKHPLGKWLNTSVSHNMHHQYFEGNYGLYFLYWDYWMGTLRKDYKEQFEEVKTRNQT